MFKLESQLNSVDENEECRKAGREGDLNGKEALAHFFYIGGETRNEAGFPAKKPPFIGKFRTFGRKSGNEV
jgi:hypothetical protein